MAEIPVFNGGQVLQVGSPVPALSGVTAGELMGDAVKEFGESGQRLFGTLLKKNRQDSDEMARLEAKQVATELKAKYALLEQRVAARGLVEGDKDGTLTAAKYREHAVNLKNETLAKYAGNKLMQLRIADNSDEELQSQFLQAFASATKNIELNKKTQEQEWLGSLIKEVEDRPENVGQIMARGELDIMQDASMPEAQKATAILARNTTLAQAVAQSYINKGNMATENPAQFFDRGLKMVDTLSPKIAPAELKKIQDDIVEKRNFRVNVVNDQVRFDRTQKQWTREDLQDRFIFEASAAISQDPTNEKMSEQIINNLTNNPVFYANPEKIAQVQNLKTVGSKLADDRVEAEFSRMMAAGASGNQLATYANSLYGPNVTQRASAKKVGELLQMAARIRESERSDPQRTMIRTQLLGAIEKLSTDAKYRNNPVAQYKFQRAGAIYALKEAAYGKNPTLEQMRAAANDVVKDITGVSNEFSISAAKEIPIPDAMTFDKEALKKGATSMARTMITSGPRTRAQLEQMYKDSIALKQRAGKLPEQKPMESLQPQAPNNIPTIPFKQFNR